METSFWLLCGGRIESRWPVGLQFSQSSQSKGRGGQPHPVPKHALLLKGDTSCPAPALHPQTSPSTDRCCLHSDPQAAAVTVSKRKGCTRQGRAVHLKWAQVELPGCHGLIFLGPYSLGSWVPTHTPVCAATGT